MRRLHASCVRAYVYWQKFVVTCNSSLRRRLFFWLHQIVFFYRCASPYCDLYKLPIHYTYSTVTPHWADIDRMRERQTSTTNVQRDTTSGTSSSRPVDSWSYSLYHSSRHDSHCRLMTSRRAEKRAAGRGERAAPPVDCRRRTAVDRHSSATTTTWHRDDVDPRSMTSTSPRALKPHCRRCSWCLRPPSPWWPNVENLRHRKIFHWFYGDIMW